MNAEIEKTLSTLGKVGTPASCVTVMKEHAESIERIRAQRYQSQKENEELVKLARQTSERLAAQLAKEIAVADEARDKEIRAVETEQIERTRIPSKAMLQSDAEHQSQLLRRSIEESRRVAALTLAAADLQTIITSTDANVIAEIVEEAISSAPPEAITRIGRAAEARAAALALEEAKTGADGLSAGTGKAFVAQLRIQEMLRRWRGDRPDARRERIVSQHTIKTMQLRAAVEGAARLFHLERTFQEALRTSRQ